MVKADLIRGGEAEAASRQLDHGLGHPYMRGGNVAHHGKAGEEVQVILSPNGHQGIDGHGLWVGGEGGQLMGETHLV